MPYLPAYSATGKSNGVIDLSSSSPVHPVQSDVVDSAEKALREGATHYTPPAGIPALTEAVAGLFAAERMAFDPTREVVTTSSAQEALYVALHTLVRPGAEVLTTDPCASEIPALIEHVGGVLRRVRSRPGPDFSVSFETLTEAISADTRVVVLGVPNDPTGRAPAGDLTEFEQCVASRDVVVLFDERYSAYGDRREGHASPAARPLLRDRAVVVRDLTAACGLESFPCGVVAGPAHLMHPITELKQIISICSPAVSQYAALTALSRVDPRAWLAGVSVDLEWLAQELTMRGFSVAGPAAGPWLLVNDGRPGLAQRFLDMGVRVADGGQFGVETADWVRITWAPRHHLLALLERLPSSEEGPE